MTSPVARLQEAIVQLTPYVQHLAGCEVDHVDVCQCSPVHFGSGVLGTGHGSVLEQGRCGAMQGCVYHRWGCSASGIQSLRLAVVASRLQSTSLYRYAL